MKHRLRLRYGTAGSGGGSGVPDVIAPILSLPIDTTVSATTGSGSVNSDEDNGTFYWYVSTSASPPSAANLKSGSGAVTFGNQAVTGAGTQTVSGGFTGLTASTTYYAHYLHRDAAGNESSISSGDGFTTQASPDVVAPTLSNPIDSAASATTGTGSAISNESNGTFYWYCSTSASPPSAANLKSGSGSVSFGNQAVSGTGTQTVTTVGGLTASTSYYLHFLHRDAAGNDSNIVSGDGFTTSAIGSLTLLFGALTKSDAGNGQAPTGLGTITSASINSGTNSNHWSVTSAGVFYPSATGDTADLNTAGGVYTLACTINGISRTITINIITGPNSEPGYSVGPKTSFPSHVFTAIADIGTAASGRRAIFLRDGAVYTTEFANFVGSKTFSNYVTVTNHDQSLRAVNSDAVPKITGQIGITSAVKVILQNLECNWTTESFNFQNVVDIGGTSNDIKVLSCHVHSDHFDMNLPVPISDWKDYQNAQGVGAGSSTKNIIIDGNLIEYCFVGAYVNSSASSYTYITNNVFRHMIADFCNVIPTTCDGSTDVRVEGNVFYSVFSAIGDGSGGRTPEDGPHTDVCQINWVSATADLTGFRFCHNIAFIGDSRGSAQLLFSNNGNTPTYFLKNPLVANNLLTGRGQQWGFGVTNADGGYYLGNAVCESDPAEATNEDGSATLVPQIIIGGVPGISGQSKGTITVKGNVSCVVSLTGAATFVTSSNITLGTNHTTNPASYAAQFVGPFGPTTRAAALAGFTTKASSTADTANAGIGQGYGTFPTNPYSSVGASLADETGAFWP